MRYSILTSLAAMALLGAGSMQSASACEYEELVDSWYRHYLGRRADECGLRAWVRELRRGESFETVQANILGSDEYYRLQGCCPRALVSGFYRDVLGRRADCCEIDGWVRRLKQCCCRVKLAREFLRSAQVELAARRPLRIVEAPNTIYVPVREYYPASRGVRIELRFGR